MTEYSRMAKGNFVASASTAVINLPFQPDYVQIFNYTNSAAAAAASKTLAAYWDASLIVSGNNPTIVQGYSSGSAYVNDVIATNGISTFSAGLSQQFGASQQIIGISKATPARVNVTAHGYSVGDTVVMQGLALGTTNNMQLLNNVPFTIVTVSDADHFDVQWNTNQSAYTALSGSPSGAVVKKVLYPFLYVPQDNVVTAVTTGATTTVTTAMYHNFEVNQEVAFRVPNFWGTTQLNSLPNLVIPGSPVYGYVVSVTDNWTFVVNINSAAYTAFTLNAAMTSTTLVGLTYAQVLSAGDVSTGGNVIFSGSSLYPAPRFPTSTNRVSTINGPAIRGAFVNNTSQGFVIGAGTATNNTSIKIMAANDVIEWRAFFHDISSP